MCFDFLTFFSTNNICYISPDDVAYVVFSIVVANLLSWVIMFFFYTGKYYFYEKMLHILMFAIFISGHGLLPPHGTKDNTLSYRSFKPSWVHK